jgi:hypothetical protein
MRKSLSKSSFASSSLFPAHSPNRANYAVAQAGLCVEFCKFLFLFNFHFRLTTSRRSAFAAKDENPQTSVIKPFLLIQSVFAKRFCLISRI